MPDKILIVDDQAVMLRLIAIPLEQEGYTIVTAMSGTDALQKIQSEQLDLVILDIMLPDMSGIDVCRRVRQNLNLTDLPIIILSGQTELAAKIQGLEAGADEYVTKPVDPKEMAARVRGLLARTQRLRQAAPAAPPINRQGKIISILGVKGGVGATTVTANLALALAMRNHRAIAVELRPYFGTLIRHFGINPSATLSEIWELTASSINERQISARLLPTHNGLHLLAGPHQLKQYREIQAEQVDALLGALVQMAEYLIIDLPHMPSVANRATLRAAQTVLLVTEPEVSSAAAAQAAVELLRAWGIGQHQIKLVVVNRMQAVQTINASDLERSLGCELLGTVTAAPDLAVSAINMGLPMVKASPNALVAGTLMEVADRLRAPRPMTNRSL